MEETTINRQVMITKASGKKEAFDIEKLKQSLRNASATDDAISMVVKDIEAWVQDGVTTHKLYARAFRTLRRINSSGALLYNLKKAIISMGPSGYPFEHFIGEVFRRQGYEVEVGVIIEGASVSHEMDVIATRGNEKNLAECKYSEKQGHSVSIQVPLYVHSRVNDIVEKLHQDQQNESMTYRAWIITNGRFSPDSIKYSRCKGINLLAWDYPAGQALKDILQREKIYPITILTSLTISEKRELMSRSIVTCDLLLAQPDQLGAIGLPKKKQSAVLRELRSLLEG